MSDRNLEQCIAVSGVSELELHAARGTDLSSFSRLYFGDEFCLHLIPAAAALRKAVAFAAERGLAFTFVTPYVTSTALPRLERALSVVERLRPEAEVVAGDWGVLNLLATRHPALRRRLGRTLVRLKRGPRSVFLKGRVPQAAYEVFRGSNLATKAFRQILSAGSVQGVELDNTLQGLDLALDGSGLRNALHVPYVYVTTSRICLLSAFTNDRLAMVGSQDGCPRPCLDRAFEMETLFKPWPQRGNPLSYEQQEEAAAAAPPPAFKLLCKGNALYYENAALPDNLAACAIDRIVHHRFFQLDDDAAAEKIGTIRL